MLKTYFTGVAYVAAFIIAGVLFNHVYSWLGIAVAFGAISIAFFQIINLIKKEK